MATTGRRRLRVAGTIALAGTLAACSGVGTGSTSGGHSTVTLTVSSFGTIGFDVLQERYERTHPDITIKVRNQEMNAHHEQLAQHLAAGTGAADVEVIEVGSIAQFKAQPDNFRNLLKFGAGDIKDRWLQWKWQQSMAPEGNYQIGLGTDVGGLAMCYRRDLFARAGLPTNREQVSKLWPTWDDYIATAKKFEATGTDAHFVDSATNVFNPVLRQQDQGLFNRQDELIVDSNPGVKKAWEVTMDLLNADASANLTAFQPEWATGFRRADFATVICPAWMMANIKEFAPDAKGKWDIAAVPGGGGNWGGSFLAIPKQSDHAQEAYDFISWMTAPEQQLKIFKKLGNLPSVPQLYDDPAVTEYSDPFFHDAPVGQIFTQSAKEFEPQYQGAGTNAVRQQMENVIRQVANDNLPAGQAWNKAVTVAERADD